VEGGNGKRGIGDGNSEGLKGWKKYSTDLLERREREANLLECFFLTSSPLPFVSFPLEMADSRA
jgi:hypothetical protein